jgi:hypothetical protein
MATRDQSYMNRTEVKAAIEYAEIAGTYDLPVTLFCTGKCVQEERDRMRRLAAMDHVELAGHNYWAFTTPVHTAWRAIAKATDGYIGSWNGPRPFQSWEIRRTIDVFDELGVNITAWRDHAYRHDRHTGSLLAHHGITHLSDRVGPSEEVHWTDGLTSVPVNTPPDHEHVYHGFRTPEFVTQSDFEGPFGSKAVSPSEWGEWVLATVADHVAADREATVLAHPACMDIADGFSTFESLCEQLATDATSVRLSTVRAA